jgi:ribonucleoside-diphosphate reductase beta chain
MKFKTFRENKINHLEQPMFFGEGVNTARYDVVKHKFFDALTEKQLSFFWRPQEVNLSDERQSWDKLNEAERHIFVSNLKRQILLDSVQGRAPAVALMPHVSLPELETWIENWGANETIHSRSYTYILQNLFTEPDKVFDSIMDIDEIVNSASDLTKHYDSFIEYGNYYNMFGYGTHTIKTNGEEFTVDINKRELKKRFYMMIVSINILEGVRFYVSFACSWAFAERELMEGNAKIIKLICRDENVHLAGTQYILNEILKEEDYESIREECKEEIYTMYKDAVNDENVWAKYLFNGDSMIGLNEKLLINFLEWITNKRLTAIGLDEIYDQKENPLPWTDKWISQKKDKDNVQVAPQETEITTYLVGNVNQDVKKDSFKSFKLGE